LVGCNARGFGRRLLEIKDYDAEQSKTAEKLFFY